MNELAIQGVSVMAIGMGTVLAFLCLMILVMCLMSKVITKLNVIFPEAIPQAAAGKKASTDDSEIVAAIVAAMFKR
ncbi:MAG: OadG family protein [bacterium]|nr:OadG family protein [bacterium]